MFNLKQMELSKMLFDSLKEKFPEIKFVGITEGCDNPNDVWVNIIYPEDEDREIEMCEMASEITTDILLDHGYNILIISGEGMEDVGTRQWPDLGFRPPFSPTHRTGGCLPADAG